MRAIDIRRKKEGKRVVPTWSSFNGKTEVGRLSALLLTNYEGCGEPLIEGEAFDFSKSAERMKGGK